jgi:hypothetical protein
MKKASLLLSILAVTALAQAQQTKTKNLIVVTLDGMRWQEVFRGADKDLLNSEFTANPKDIKATYWRESAAERRKILMPFLWSVVEAKGQLYGNRDIGNKEEVENKYKFSYPGYNELMTGFPDKKVNSNDKEYNPNQNVLEYINKQRGFEGKVAAFSSWDVFPYILNDKRSGFPVSSGIVDFLPKKGASEFKVLNEMQKQMLSPVGDGVRPDVLTYQLGKTYMKTNKPRAVYFAFDETDDYAHGGFYHFYLKQATKIDQMLADLWSFIQSDPFYKDKTTLLITCDHGRGDTSPAEWKDHGSDVRHAEQTWFAIMGPDTAASGEMKASDQTIYHSQLAQTMSELLGLNFKPNAGHPVGNSISTVFKAR